jgi:hypothetical protein
MIISVCFACCLAMVCPLKFAILTLRRLYGSSNFLVSKSSTSLGLPPCWRTISLTFFCDNHFHLVSSDWSYYLGDYILVFVATIICTFVELCLDRFCCVLFYSDFFFVSCLSSSSTIIWFTVTLHLVYHNNIEKNHL